MNTDLSPEVTSDSLPSTFSTSQSEAGRSLFDAAYDQVAKAGSAIKQAATDHPYATAGGAILVTAAAFALIRKLPMKQLAPSLRESSTSVFPHYIQKMDVAKDTLVIGKLKDLKAYKYLEGEFSLSWPSTTKGLEIPKNIHLLDNWVLRGGRVKDISPAVLKSPSEHLYWERAFIKRYAPTDGRYFHLPTGATTPPAKKLPWHHVLRYQPSNSIFGHEPFSTTLAKDPATAQRVFHAFAGYPV